MSVHSGGILLFKFVDGGLCVMLVHPGGPFWAKKDAGAWSIPKGIIVDMPINWHRQWVQDIAQYGMSVWPEWMQRFEDY